MGPTDRLREAVGQMQGALDLTQAGSDAPEADHANSSSMSSRPREPHGVRSPSGLLEHSGVEVTGDSNCEGLKA